MIELHHGTVLYHGNTGTEAGVRGVNPLSFEGWLHIANEFKDIFNYFKNKINYFFYNIWRTYKKSRYILSCTSPHKMNLEFEFRVIDVEETSNIITSLKINQVYGYDLISNKW